MKIEFIHLMVIIVGAFVGGGGAGLLIMEWAFKNHKARKDER